MLAIYLRFCVNTLLLINLTHANREHCCTPFPYDTYFCFTTERSDANVEVAKKTTKAGLPVYLLALLLSAAATL